MKSIFINITLFLIFVVFVKAQKPPKGKIFSANFDLWEKKLSASITIPEKYYKSFPLTSPTPRRNDCQKSPCFQVSKLFIFLFLLSKKKEELRLTQKQVEDILFLIIFHKLHKMEDKFICMKFT